MISTANSLRANVAEWHQCKVAGVVGLMVLSPLAAAGAAELSPSKKLSGSGAIATVGAYGGFGNCPTR